MRIHTLVEMTWCDKTKKYVVVHEEGYDYPENGQVALCKGASQQQNDLAASQSQFYNTLTNSYNQQFANQSAILASLNKSLSPTIAAGPSQFGYSPDQLNDLNATAIQGTAQSYQNAQRALQNQQATRGGGNMQLPSGVDAQNSATLATAGANQESSELLGIKNAGYAQGNTNYNNAVNAEQGVAGLYNPNGYAGSAIGAGNSADNEANIIQKVNSASSPWSAIGGILGGAASAFTGGFAGQLGKNLFSTKPVTGGAYGYDGSEGGY